MQPIEKMETLAKIHEAGVVAVGGLAVYFAVKLDKSVTADHAALGMSGKHGRSF